MLWALEVRHLRRCNERFGLIWVVAANWPAPNRTTVVAIILEDELSIIEIGSNDCTDIAHRNGKCTFPARALSSGICPLAFECRLCALSSRIRGIIVFGHVVGVEGGIHYILDSDANILALTQLIRPGWWVNPTPLVARSRGNIIFLPIVEVPRLTITTDSAA